MLCPRLLPVLALLLAGPAASAPAGSPPPAAHPTTDARDGWRDLFAPDLADATLTPGSWVFENGILARRGPGHIWTRAAYRNFILDLEFRIEEGSNSGVFLRSSDTVNWLQNSIEIDVNDSYGPRPRYAGLCGAVYDCVVPSKNAIKAPGEWNRFTITCRDSKISVILNGELIVDMDLDRWTEPHRNPDGTRNKFNTAYKDMSRIGRIGLQDHREPVWYRAIRIKVL